MQRVTESFVFMAIIWMASSLKRTHTHISEKHLWRATAEEDRPIDRTDTKRRENMQKGIALSHTELVSCNLPHEPACSIRGMEVFFSLVYIYKATLKLIRIHSFAIDIVMLIEYYSSVIWIAHRRRKRFSCLLCLLYNCKCACTREMWLILGRRHHIQCPVVIFEHTFNRNSALTNRIYCCCRLFFVRFSGLKP